MKKLFLILFLFISYEVAAQTLQYGDWYFRGGSRLGINKPTNNLHPNSSFEVNDSSTGSLFRIYKNGGIQSFKFKNNSAEDSILTTDQFGNFKLRLKPSTTMPWDSITGKPSLLISGNNLADVSNVATARTNLSVYSIATVNDSLLNHYTKSQSDARFKSIDWFPSVANVTGLPDSLTNLQARIQAKLTKSDADTYYPSIQRMQDSLAAVQARVQNKEPFISPGTSAQYWRGDKSWQTLDKSAVGLSAVPNVDATNPANISQSATYRFVTDSEKSTWNAKQNALGYTPENTANKATDFSTVNNTLYPTVQAVSNAITSATSSYIPLSQKGANNGVATLDVGGKVPFSQLPAALMIYKGTWNVSTNTPTLADGTGVTGWVYIVSVGGTINTGSGNITYSAGDYAIHNGSTWEKSAGTNNVASVNGQQGVVNLTTANISESGNLYYTDARTRAALSFTPGSGAYNSSTGVITIPTNTNQLTNGAGFITGFTETDPTIYAWAKAATKPSYSWTEIGSRPTALSQFTNDLIYSWALQATKPSYTYGEIGGTVPTWNQNTTGNASTASSSPLLSSISASAFNSSQTPTSLNYGIQTFFVGPAVGEGSWQNYGSIVNVRTYSGGGASMQMYIPYSPNFGGTGLQVRFGNYDVSLGDSWTSWKTLLATDNYNSYAPSLTGVGASGNWGINITGNAASATTWFNAGQYDAVGNNANASAFMGFNTSTGKWAAYQVSYMQGWLGLGSAAFTASSAYYAAGSTVNNSTNFAGIGYGGGYSSGTISYSMVYNSTNSRWEAATAGNIQTWLGLGSNAYSSTSFFPTSGGTLAGHLNMGGWNISNVTNISGASLDLTGSISLNNGEFLKARRTSGSALVPVLGFESGTDDLIQVFSNSWKLRGTGGIGDEKITVMSTGRVGVGTNNPVNARLEVIAASGEVFRADAASGALRIVADQTGVTLAGATTVLNGLNLTGGTLPATVGSTLSYAYNSPSHTFAFGDGTGYNLKFVKRASSVTTDLFTLTDAGVGTFASNLTSGGSIYAVNIQASNLLVSTTSSEFLRSIPTVVGAAQFQAWYNSAGTRRGFFGFGGTSSDILYLHNETGGTLDFVGSNSNFSNTVSAYGYSTNSTAGGWDRAFSFKGSGGTNRGGFGAFGTDNTVDYYYIGQDYTSTAIRVAYSNYVVGLATDLQFRSNSGFGILSENGNRVISITNGAMNVTGTASISSSLTAASLIRSGGTSSQFLKADGSVDANTYATTASLSGYVNTSTNQLEISGNKSFLGAVEVLSIKTTGGPGTPGVLKFGTKTNDTVFTGGSAYSIPVNIDGTTYYIRLWAGIN